MTALAEPFRTNVEKFMTACRNGGADIVKIDETRRHPETQYLMYWAWKIGKDGYKKGADAPPTQCSEMDFDVDWFWTNPRPTDDCPEAEALQLPRYLASAITMVKHFGLISRPGTTSKFSTGKAINLGICWKNDIRIVDAKGTTHLIPGPGGPLTPQLHVVAETYGVHKMKTCEFESARTVGFWSDNGHYE